MGTKISGLAEAALLALGATAGGAPGASSEDADGAAFALLDVAREVESRADRVALLGAIGCAFRSAWLVPYVHACLSDPDVEVVRAAIGAAGGLGFPALEASIAAFLGDDKSATLRAAAIGALGRMGAESAAARLVGFAVPAGPLAGAAVTALTEIRSRLGADAARALLADPALSCAAARYLAEIGDEAALPALRVLARHEDPEVRIAAGLASRAFKAERMRDADGRILAALADPDRAVRAALARRLRTLPVAEVLEHAALLLSDDAEGVIQAVAEVRVAEVTRFLLGVAADSAQTPEVRARAAGAIEANEPWEREALFDLATGELPVEVRVAALQAASGFASLGEVLARASALAEDPSAGVRGALLWAIQLAVRPGPGRTDDARAEAIVARALADDDAVVRRRAAYVAGNLDAAGLVPALLELARRETERSDVRIAAFVALGDLGAPGSIPDLVHLWNREHDPAALAAVSRALERAVLTSGAGDVEPPRSAPASLGRARDRLVKLLASPDARARAAACRVAGLHPAPSHGQELHGCLDDEDPRVREQALVAVARLGGEASVAPLCAALDDVEVAVQERACDLLLAARGGEALPRFVHALAWLCRARDRDAAARLGDRLAVPEGEAAPALEPLAQAIARVHADHPLYERLLELRVEALERASPAAPSSRTADVDARIAELFPTWTRLSAVRGFAPLARSVRTAESLAASTEGAPDADHAGAIVLWTKGLEGYVHAWLAPRLAALQERPAALWELADRMCGSAWPTYQRALEGRWTEAATIGGLTVEVPLRAAINAMRELQERRLKPLDSPLSLTEWGRMMLFLCADHASGAKNLLGANARGPDHPIRVAHGLQVLAQVRNAVTHRSVAGADTARAFRGAYYALFEDLTALA